MITAHVLAMGLHRRPTATGIDGTPVEVLRHRALDVVVTRHASPLPRSRDAVLAHAAICEELMTKAEAVLPVRFGAAFDDEAALRASLDGRHDQLVGGLAHVRSRAEIGVRVRWDDPCAPQEPDDRATRDGATSGRAYLMARVAEEHRRREVRARAEAIADRLHRAIAADALDSRLEVLPTGGVVMSGAYLVGRENPDRLVARVLATADEHPDLDFVCTGPWPPYSFADAEEETCAL